jgi:hypothetical protein
MIAITGGGIKRTEWLRRFVVPSIRFTYSDTPYGKAMKCRFHFRKRPLPPRVFAILPETRAEKSVCSTAERSDMRGKAVL